MNALSLDISRRGLLAGGGALVISFSLPGSHAAAQGVPVVGIAPDMLDSWLRIDAQGVATIYTGRAEFGQGMKTAMIQLAAEELNLLVHIDGQATVAQITQASGKDQAAVIEILRTLINRRLIEPAAAGESSVPDFLTSNLPFKISPKASADAEASADAAHSFLEKNGYYVRIARRAKTRGAASKEKPAILLVEDDGQLATLLRTYLTYHGWTVSVAYDRDSIVAQARSARPDLVLLDVMLPDVDGFEVLSRMRHHPVLKDVPVIMLTAKATRAAVLNGLARGANGYITKPFELESVAKAVSAVLGVPLSGLTGLKP